MACSFNMTGSVVFCLSEVSSLLFNTVNMVRFSLASRKEKISNRRGVHGLMEIQI
jgi:hypothetical protein